MKKLGLLLVSLLLVAIAAPLVSANEFYENGVLESNVCVDKTDGYTYKYEGYWGPVGTPCTWHIGVHQYWGVFGG